MFNAPFTHRWLTRLNHLWIGLSLLLGVVQPLPVLPGEAWPRPEALPQPQAFFTVNSTNDAVDVIPGNGMCATSSGTCTLRAAVQEANAFAGTDVILLPAGVYWLTRGGADEDAAATGDLDVTSHLTILGALSTTTTINGNGLDRVFQVMAGTAFTLEAVTLRAGQTTTSGGAIYAPDLSSTLHVSNTRFLDNSALNATGGAIETGGTLSVVSSIFFNNQAREGGAIFLANGAGEVRNSYFSDNVATNATGGGLANFANSLLLVDSTFNHNQAASAGGGLSNHGANATIRNTVFAANTAVLNAQGGGGVFNSAGNLTLLRVTLNNNTAVKGGGLAIDSGQVTMMDSQISVNTANRGGGIAASGVLTLANSFIFNNTATVEGGGVANLGGTVLILASTLAENTAQGSGAGGGVLNGAGSSGLHMANSTLYGNRAGAGGGLYADGISGGGAWLTNTTFVDNVAGNGRNIYSQGGGVAVQNTILKTEAAGENCAGSINDMGHNLQYPDAACGPTIPTVDPRLGPLQDNGGPTWSMLPQMGSPAIDAGDNAACAAAGVNNTDQRGVARPIDNSQRDTLLCDIGAVERGWSVMGESNGDAFGGALATAGDVNGDGYTDALVAAPYFGSDDRGQVYVYLGSGSGLRVMPALTLAGAAANDAFGAAAATAGDVNGDGYADVIIGARRYGRAGRAYLYLGSASGLAATPALTLTGEQTLDLFGDAVATAGDVNNDGYADVIIGAHAYGAGRGRAYLHLGSATGLNPTPALILSGGAATGGFGFPVQSAGDVNGDSYADVLIGAPEELSNTGRAYLYFGSASGLGTAATLLTGAAAGDAFGTALSSVGDVNGDGYAEIAIGAPGYNAETGRIYIYAGGASGLVTSPMLLLTGPAASARLAQVASAGDMNGDGYADLLAGAPQYNSGQGRVYVHLGSASGLNSTPALTLTGESLNDAFGAAVATAGDANDDGYSDFVVGATSYAASTNRGRAYLYYGGAGSVTPTPNWIVTGETNNSNLSEGGMAAGDINGDGYADVIIGAPSYPNNVQRGRVYGYWGSANGLSLTPAFTLTGENNGDAFGGFVAGVGDVNGDGYTDIVVSAAGYPAGGNTGRAYLYRGSATGLNLAPERILTGFNAGDKFGAGVGNAGDVNGDGYADVLIGARGYAANTGRSYLYLGSANSLSATPALTLTGENANDQFGLSLGTVGDVNSDGYSDFMVAANHYPGNLLRGRAYLYLGSASLLNPTPALMLTGENEGDMYGNFTAGDLNGDGYSDVVIGAKGYLTATGRVYVYLGNSSGLSAAPTLTLTGEALGSVLGQSLATTGDMNGDGHADVVIGAYDYASALGRVYGYWGWPASPWGVQTTPGGVQTTPGGLQASPAFSLTGQATEDFGATLALVGDVNGDGYTDLLIGARGYAAWKGRAYLYYGNAARGLSLTPQQRRLTNTAPIAHLGLGDSVEAFRLFLRGRTPYGRGKVKLEWEIKPLGIAFDGVGTEQSTTWLDTGTAGAMFNTLVGNLASGTHYHWRVRLHYHPATTPWQPHSRWFTQPWSGWDETRLHTAGTRTTWARTFGGPNADLAVSVQPTAEGGYLVVGQTQSFGAGNEDVWLLKLNADGTTAWQKTYGGPGTERPQGQALPTAEGGYLVLADTNSFGIAGGQNAWLLKLDAAGNVLWQKTYGGNAKDTATAVQPTGDGGYIVAGYTESFGAGALDAWVLKLDAAGEVLWQKTYGAASNDMFTAIQPTTDGGYVAVGETQSFGMGGGDGWVMKLDAAGGMVWQKAYGGADWESFRAVQLTNAGGYSVLGLTASFGAGAGTGALDIWVLQLNSMGAIVWQKAYGGVGEERANALEATGDGGYLVSGTTDSFGAGQSEVWLLKLDAVGAVSWQKTYGGVGSEMGATAQQTLDGGYSVAGTTNSQGAGDLEIWVLKLGVDGTLDLPCDCTRNTNVAPAPTTATISNLSATSLVAAATVSNTSTTPTTPFPIIETNTCFGTGRWTRTYGGASEEVLQAVMPTSEGYVLTGRNAANDALLLQVDASGNVLWKQAYGGAGVDEIYTLRPTNEGGYIVAGQTASFGAGGTDAWVLKLNATGDVVWQKTYGGSSADAAWQVRATSDNGYIVVGQTHSFGAGNGDVWLLKLDAAGNVLWQKTYGGGAAEAQVYASLEPTNDGGYIVATTIASVGAGGGDVWVLKVDGAGAVVWQRTLGGSLSDAAFSLYATATGDYVVAGHTASFDASAWVLKLSANGEVVWQKTYGGAASESAAALRPTPDGGYIFVGSTTSFGAGGEEVWLVKLDAGGNVLWQRAYGGSGADSGQQVWETADGGYIVGARSDSFGVSVRVSDSDSGNGTDFWLLKLDANGEVLCFPATNTAATTTSPNPTIAAPFFSAVASAATTSTPNLNNRNTEEIHTTYLCTRYAAGQLQFSAPSYTFTENIGTALITILRTNGSDGPATISYSTGGGFATPPVSGTLSFAPGQISQTLPLNITDDLLDEPNETLSITLSAPLYATLGTPAVAALIITDNDPPAVAQFSTATYSVPENSSMALVTVTLNTLTSFTATLAYTSANGTAQAGSDYTPLSGTLTFAPGQVSQAFTVSITDDVSYEGNETLSLGLSNPANATLGAPTVATLTITDNDPPVIAQFSAAAYTVSEVLGSATLTVTLNTAPSLTATVAYATGGGTATPGSDYTPISGTLTFNPGQLQQTITVSLTDDLSHEITETLSLTLSNPSNASLGTLNPASVIIIDNDPAPSIPVFLPFVGRLPFWCFYGPNEAEPNDVALQANGPLCGSRTLVGYHNGTADDRDYFSLRLDLTGTLTVALANVVGAGVQLQIFDVNFVSMGYDAAPPYLLTCPSAGPPACTAGGPGVYYIRVYTPPGYSATEPYILTVTYP